MNLPYFRRLFPAVLLFSLAATGSVVAQNVTTYRYDNRISGINAREKVLTPANVNVATFGELFNDPVDGQAYAQPLYLSHVAIPGKGTRNVVYIATCHDTLYAFDADAGGDPLWMTSFIDPEKGIAPVPQTDTRTGDISPEIGIVGTPVINADTGTLYLVAKTKETCRGDNHVHYVQKLHALDVATGAEKFGGPAVIGDTSYDEAWNQNYHNYDYNLTIAPNTPSAPGKGAGSSNGVVYFNAFRENQRPSLTFLHGVVYVAWASHGDHSPFHGWVVGFDAKTLIPRPNCIWCATPDGEEGGVWQSGCGPAIDDGGNLYLSTGNGSFSGDKGGRDWSQTFLKFVTSAGLSTAQSAPGSGQTFDYFTPFNEKSLSDGDVDVGSGGMLIVDVPGNPAPHLVIGTSKEGTYYVMNRDDMGRFDPATNHVVQRFETPDRLELMATPVFFKHALFYNRNGEDLRTRVFARGQFSATYNRTANSFAGRGGGPIISSNGAKDGIVWMLNNSGPAELMAYSADALAAPPPAPVAAPSSAASPPGADAKPPPALPTPAPKPVAALYTGRLLDGGTKFTHPIEINGKVYALGASRRGNRVVSAHLCVFGLLPVTMGTAKPETPAHLQAGSDTPGTVLLSWVNHDPHVSGFVIERSPPDGSAFVQVGTAGESDASYQDNTVTGATAYQYRVTAVNKNGSSAPTPPLNAKSHDYITEDGLAAYWSLDEDNGSTAHDLTGRGHDGNIIGEVSWSQGIQDSPGLEFHGTGNARSHIEVPQKSDLDFAPAQSFSIVVWARPSSFSGRWAGVVTKLRQTGAGWLGVYASPDNRWAFRGSDDTQNLLGGKLIPDSWQQVVVVQDGAARTRTLYVNGVQVANAQIIAPADGTGTIWIGQANADNEAFNGNIDDVRIYDRALVADDVKKLFGTYLPTVCLKEPADNSTVSGKKEVQFIALASSPAPGTAIDEVRFFEGGKPTGSG